MEGRYYALHIRRGDKVNEANFGKVSHSPSWYISRIQNLKEKDLPVYIMTDEKDRAFFHEFEDNDITVLFHEDLPFVSELEDYLTKFPVRMKMDILGLVEQLLGAYSLKFLGSGYSTFTTYILRYFVLISSSFSLVLISFSILSFFLIHAVSRFHLPLSVSRY